MGGGGGGGGGGGEVRTHPSHPHPCGPGARFSKAPETFRARKAILSCLYLKSRVVYRPETLYEGNLFHVKNMTGIKQLCNHKVLDFSMAFRMRKLFGTFEKRAPQPGTTG